jgi:hypothetical protein
VRFSEGLVAGDDEAGPLVAAGDELEEQVGGFRLERDVADLVDDQQRVSGEPGELGLELARCGEPAGPLRRGGEGDAVPGLAGADRDAGGEVGLAGAASYPRFRLVRGVFSQVISLLRLM